MNDTKKSDPADKPNNKPITAPKPVDPWDDPALPASTRAEMKAGAQLVSTHARREAEAAKVAATGNKDEGNSSE